MYVVATKNHDKGDLSFLATFLDKSEAISFRKNTALENIRLYETSGYELELKNDILSINKIFNIKNGFLGQYIELINIPQISFYIYQIPNINENISNINTQNNDIPKAIIINNDYKPILNTNFRLSIFNNNGPDKSTKFIDELSHVLKLRKIKHNME